jgi:hypothetical protein
MCEQSLWPVRGRFTALAALIMPTPSVLFMNMNRETKLYAAQYMCAVQVSSNCGLESISASRALHSPLQRVQSGRWTQVF